MRLLITELSFLDFVVNVRKLERGNINMDKREKCLKDLMVFSRLDDSEIEWICHKAYRRNYEKGEIIYFEKDDIEKLYFLIKGRVKLTMMSAEGKEKVVDILHQGDIFGEISFFDHNPQPLTAEVQENCTLLIISWNDFENIIKDSPSLSIKIIEALAKKTRLLANQVRELVFQDAEGRLAALLKRFASEYGKKDNENIIIGIGLTHQEIANLLGTSRVTVTKIINKFEKEKILRTQNRKIIIQNMSKLKEKMEMLK